MSIGTLRKRGDMLATERQKHTLAGWDGVRGFGFVGNINPMISRLFLPGGRSSLTNGMLRLPAACIAFCEMRAA